MIEGQIRPNEVTDSRILQAFSDIPRELFVPRELRGVAYVDEDIEVATGRSLIEPMVLARLIQAVEIEAGDVVLDVGCASGYSSAILAGLAGSVVALEEDVALGHQAKALLAELQCDNVVVVSGPLAKGFVKQAPYDAIVINGMIEELPSEFEKQLAEGGRLAAVVLTEGVGRAALFLKTGGVLGRRDLFDAHVAPLPGFQKPSGFQF